MPEAQLLLDVRNELGECPTWSEPEQSLYWVDILNRRINRWHEPSGELTHWQFEQKVGCFGLREQGGMIVALGSEVYLFDTETEALTLVASPEAHLEGNRLNDGKVSPEGRFWVGSMHDVPVGPGSMPRGSLYRIDPDGSCHQMVTDVRCSNGLAWSPDGRTMYHADSRGPWIKAYDYDPDTGEISNCRLFAEPGEEEGRPDGAGMDEEGHYWSAGVSAGCMNRFAPDGTLVEKISVPTPAPTMCCFGGTDRKTMYITSHRERPGTAEAFPTAGGLFTTRVDVPGVKTAYFKG